LPTTFLALIAEHIQAELGHASPDTVMIYAKLYFSQLIEEYRKTVRSLYNAYYGEEGLKNPAAEEWAAFAASSNLREMGRHLCALPTGEHCPKGLYAIQNPIPSMAAFLKNFCHLNGLTLGRSNACRAPLTAIRLKQRQE
jgi:hypothetical protein